MSSSDEPSGSESHLSELKGVSVLVVEDTWPVAKALKGALEQLGMHVIGPTATTADARRLVASHAPIVALVDVNLKQEMAGDLIDELYERGIRVIIVSGYAVPPVSMEKAAAFVQKPFNGKELVAALRAAVGRLH
jgi:DNA-binding response OmpR family regulator